MIPYIVFNSTTGKVLRAGDCQDADLSRQAQPGETVIRWDAKFDVLRHHRFVNGALTPDDETITKDALLRQLASRRWEIETGGVSFRGKTVDSDDRAKLLVSGAKAKGVATTWKTRGGEWLTLAAGDVSDLYDAIFNHVSACFAREAALAGMIESASHPEALAEAVARFWP